MTMLMNSQTTCTWGSDYIAELMKHIGLEFIALNPGSSYRGIHDSLVNYLGDDGPKILTVLHEEHAIAISHGYAKVTERPMGAFVHANVGLMHASMGIFDAYCDRVPVMVFGATGPVDAAKRRPWIDWLHTTKDQAAMIRAFVKWDGEPTSLEAARDAMMRAHRIACTGPRGPTYVCFDSELQEAEVQSAPPLPRLARYRVPNRPAARPHDVKAAAEKLRAAANPLILVGRGSRDEGDWARRVRLAEHTGAKVLTDFKLAAAFPTWHPLHAAQPGYFLDSDGIAALRAADLILSLDWIDLAGTLREAFGDGECPAHLMHVSLDETLHNGVGGEQQAVAPADTYLLCDPDEFAGQLLEELRSTSGPLLAPQSRQNDSRGLRRSEPQGIDGMSLAGFSSATSAFLQQEAPTCLIRTNLGWPGGAHPIGHPLDYLGYDGGGGVGSGPGMAVGAALALKGSRRLPVAVLGDGDYLMGATALWTAVNYKVPLLIVVANNRSFFNDEVHQERVALQRDRPVENKGIGQRIEGADITMLAKSLGAQGIGPVKSVDELWSALEAGGSAVRAGHVVVIDAYVAREYAKTMANGLARGKMETNHERG
ncbi:thiamine pyrophosphate-dependent acetolactate synthase large subunit-like protein [Paraburkholderia sp. RAU6.4a]